LTVESTTNCRCLRPTDSTSAQPLTSASGRASDNRAGIAEGSVLELVLEYELEEELQSVLESEQEMKLRWMLKGLPEGVQQFRQE